MLQLERECGLGANRLSSLKRGSLPRSDLVVAICERTGVDPWWLMTGKGAMYGEKTVQRIETWRAVRLEREGTHARWKMEQHGETSMVMPQDVVRVTFEGATVYAKTGTPPNNGDQALIEFDGGEWTWKKVFWRKGHAFLTSPLTPDDEPEIYEREQIKRACAVWMVQYGGPSPFEDNG